MDELIEELKGCWEYLCLYPPGSKAAQEVTKDTERDINDILNLIKKNVRTKVKEILGDERNIK